MEEGRSNNKYQKGVYFFFYLPHLKTYYIFLLTIITYHGNGHMEACCDVVHPLAVAV